MEDNEMTIYKLLLILACALLLIGLSSCTKTVTVEVEKEVQVEKIVVTPEPIIQYIRIESVDVNDSIKCSDTLNLQ